MTPSKNKGYTASDIERYHSGKMSQQERHAIEKAALDDPFLADALDGYAFTSTPAADLAAIQSRLDEKVNPKKTIPLFQKYKWLSAAAIILVIAGGGWLAYTISGNEKTPSVAVQKENKQKETPGTNPPQASEALDSSVYSNHLVENVQAIKSRRKEKQESAENASTNQKTNQVVVNDYKDGQVLTSRATSSNDKISTPPQNEVASATSPYANAQKPEANMNRIPDARANNVTVLRNQDFLKESEADKTNLSGRVQGVKVKDSIKNFNVVLQPQKMDSGDLVVVGYGSTKKTKDAFSRITYPRVIIDTLEPADGYADFDSYITSNFKMPEEVKSKTVSGEVELSFDVSENGQAINITVIKSLCQKCDEEAVRLLKEGPKWKKKKDKKGKIIIKF